MARFGLYARHAQFLDAAAVRDGLDLGQGDTPLLRSRSIGPKAGLPELYFKLESMNPTGSYKDRFAGLAIGGLCAAGAERCVATSSGNTGAALAGFAAAAGLGCGLYVSENAPAGKLSQMLAYGADVYRVRHFTVDAAESALISSALTEEAAARGMPIFITAYAISPGPMEGIKTIAYEIDAQLPEVSDLFAPVGGGGLHVATARGFADLVAAGLRKVSPRMHVVQPAGNDTVVTPLREGADRARSVVTSTSISGLGVSNVLDGDTVIGHAHATGGQGYLLDEDHIRAVQQRLAQEEGILVEPAGAVAVAGALAAFARGEIGAESRAVCLLTGHGFKDPGSVAAMGRGARLIGRSDISDSFNDTEVGAV